MLLRRALTTRPLHFGFSTVTAIDQNPPQAFRTFESDPTKHTSKHIGRFYYIPENIKKKLFSHIGFPKQYEKQMKTFAESCLMIRQPAVEIMNYMQDSISPEKPVIRYVLYGEFGVGKTLTMAHLAHYGHVAGFILVHSPLTMYWFKNPKEHAPSSTKDGMRDLPLDAAAWLIHFKAQNYSLLNQPDMKVSQDYVWTKRENTPKDSPLLELVDLGINRVKFSCDVVDAVIEELKQLSTSGKCKILALIDSYNAVWNPLCAFRKELKVRVKTDQVTLTKPLKSITNYNWTNGAVIVTVDPIATVESYNWAPFPKTLLGNDGFEHLDPFIPIHVNNYDDMEFKNCIDYYLDRRWIQNTKVGFDQELQYLSNKNPYTVMRMCAPL